MFCCAPRTVTKWIDSGKLKGFRVPDSKDRRVYIEDAISFATANNLPVEPLLQHFEEVKAQTAAKLKVWIIDEDECLYLRLFETVLSATGARIEAVRKEPGDLGFSLGVERPSVIVCNYDLLGREEFSKLLRLLETKHTCKLIVTASEEILRSIRIRIEKLNGEILVF